MCPWVVKIAEADGLMRGSEPSESSGEGRRRGGRRWKALRNRDDALFHHTAVAKALGGFVDDTRHWHQTNHATARQRFGARPSRRSEHPPKRARRGESVGSPSEAGSDPVAVISRGIGCPSLKTEIWIARVGLNMLGDSAAHGDDAGSGLGGMSIGSKKRIPYAPSVSSKPRVQVRRESSQCPITAIC